ncbi:MAG: stage II sporulation protein M [Egibacteraceae bacterium]
MDVDRFITANQPVWDRLEALLGGGAGSVSQDEVDDLVRLYQQTSTHLSYARTYLRDPSLVAALSHLAGRASAVIYGTRPRTLRALGRYLADTFPAALWHIRWFVLASAALFLLPALGVGLWMANSPQALNALAPPALREAYVRQDFEAYYSSQPATVFASQVTTNNVQVSVLAFAAGVLLCAPTAYILAANGANVGFAAGLFAAAGQQVRFWGLILPHGLLEVTAVLVAGATGLRLGWAIIDPGDRPRADALTEEARRAITVVIGLVLVFVVAGTIEGFVSGSRLPTWARVGVGIAAEAVVVSYAVLRGRGASARGLTGALGEQR